MAVLEKPKRQKEPKIARNRDRACSWEESLRRIDRVCSREIRTGIPIRVPKTPKMTISGIMLPVEPFRAWLEGLVAQAESRGSRAPNKDVAASLDVASRRLDEYLHRMDRVDESTVDRVCSQEGSTSLAELYPHGPDTVWLPVARWSPGDRPPRCSTPKCRERRAEGSRFCAACAARLRGVREALQADKDAFSSRIGRKGARPNCCNRPCPNPRYGTDRFCDDCQAAGYTEDDYS